MAKKQYYAVKTGKKTGLFQSWEECRECVEGYPGAQYKGFSDINEAWRYLGICAGEPVLQASASHAGEGEAVPASRAKHESELHAGGNRAGEDPAVHIYVDGSYAGGDAFSYGMVVLRDGEELCFSQKITDADLARMRNVAGEIEGAKAAMRYALEQGLRHIVIFHDYEGIAKWCTRGWKANLPATQAYRDFYDAARKQVRIDFRKVAGHSGDRCNNLADKLAKEALEAEAEDGEKD